MTPIDTNQFTLLKLDVETVADSLPSKRFIYQWTGIIPVKFYKKLVTVENKVQSELVVFRYAYNASEFVDKATWESITDLSYITDLDPVYKKILDTPRDSLNMETGALQFRDKYADVWKTIWDQNILPKPFCAGKVMIRGEEDTEEQPAVEETQGRQIDISI